ncbi:50S ribosomal protein L11 methyltransferase [Acidihalobacter ferrooxydans]|uniref:Ribosomal protein L11 methyltransferase n=1 Tax=Acidihalobacter ferrooxydans TaxID=1765967 RepID=A0A1P8UJR8_9GAMM|nr:50S ribosomal protein L11 methyltransferase [Acidihalobacter ferrooxydans]APZ44044.1 ribosomal protein L11 methyltransferase [Acidihalobacter ferrooxydans]
MAWQNLILTAAREQVDALETRLLGAGALSVSVGDAGDVPVLEPAPGETPLWPENTLTALFEADVELAALASALSAEFALAAAPRTETVADQDWERAWMADFQPMRFGARLWICPSWHTPPADDAVNLILDPGLAFGTGTHPTTALCLEWLDANPPCGALALDYGCGSGILSLAALKLGARHVWAVDIDPQALTATADNAARNAIPASNLYAVEPPELPPLTADLVMANILSGPLIELAPRLCQHLKPGGKLILSGILATQADAVRDAYNACIAHWEPRAERDGWVRLAGRRAEA